MSLTISKQAVGRTLCLAMFGVLAISNAAYGATPEMFYFAVNEGTGTSTQNHASPGQGPATVNFTGSVTWITPGQLGAAAIDTTNGYIDTGWNTTFNGSFTIEFWFLFQSQSLAWYLCGDDDHASFRMFTSGAAGTGIRVIGGGFATLTVGTGLHGSWNHFAFVYDASNQTTSAYVNGTYAGGATNQVPTSGTSLGTFQVASHNNGTRTFPGYIDDFRYWSQARTAAQIAGNMNREVLSTPDLHVTLSGPNTATNVNSHDTGPTGDGLLLADIKVETILAAWTVTEIEFTADGTGNDATAFNQLALYEDTNGNGQFDGSTTDLLATATAAVAFQADNGTYSAQLSNASIPPQTSRRFFLLGRFNGTAFGGETFTAAVTSVTASSTGGGAIIGVPTAFSAGLEINPSILAVTRHGPATLEDVPFDEAGPTGDGHLLLDFSVTASNGAFTLDAFDIRAFGTGNDADHYAQIAVYEDDGNGTWDGAGVDTLVDSASGFPNDNGTWRATLSTTALPISASRRFFVVGIFNGMAPNGLMFGVALQDVQVASPPAYLASGLPTAGGLTVQIATPLTATSFDPLVVPAFTERPITITGTGFALPLTVTIGGEPAGGTAQVNANGTEITGLTTPPSSGVDLEIVLTVNGEPPLILQDQFTYGSINAGSSGCASQAGAGSGLGGLLLLLLLASIRRRCAATSQM